MAQIKHIAQLYQKMEKSEIELLPGEQNAIPLKVGGIGSNDDAIKTKSLYQKSRHVSCGGRLHQYSFPFLELHVI